MTDSPSIALVGDALTARGSWPDWLPGRRVDVVTIKSGTTEELLSMAETLAERRPDSISLHAGGVDLLMRRSVEHVVRNVEYLMVTLRRELPGARLLTQSILPYSAAAIADAEDAQPAPPSVGLPPWARSFSTLARPCSARPAHINADFLEDPQRLNLLGYEAWAAVRAALERLEAAPPHEPTHPDRRGR